MIRSGFLRACALGVVLLLAGCGSFSITTPADFVERPQSEWSSYAYRAMNADAVVLGVREIDELQESEADVSLAFWKKAVLNRLQASQAYAILAEEELSVAGGQKGVLLRMAREESKVTYDYWVALVDVPGGVFSPPYLYVIEAGGQREAFKKVEEQLLGAIKSLRP